MSFITNPYNASMHGLGDVELFAGRTQELDALLAHVLGDDPTPRLVVGTRRSGKTSLLQRVASLVRAEGVDVVWFESNELAAFEPAEIPWVVAREFSAVPWLGLQRELPRSLGELLVALHGSVEMPPRRLVLFIDDLTVGASAPSALRLRGAILRLAQRLFQDADLRSKIDLRVVADAGTRGDIEVIRDLERSDLRWLKPLILAPLSEDEVRQVIAAGEKVAGASGVWTEAAREAIVASADGWPLLAQQICYQTWAIAAAGENGVRRLDADDVQRGMQAVRSNVTGALSAVWDEMGGRGRFLTFVLANAPATGPIGRVLLDQVPGREGACGMVLVDSMLEETVPALLHELGILRLESPAKEGHRVWTLRSSLLAGYLRGLAEDPYLLLEELDVAAAERFANLPTTQRARGVGLAEILTMNPNHPPARRAARDLLQGDGLAHGASLVGEPERLIASEVPTYAARLAELQRSLLTHDLSGAQRVADWLLASGVARSSAVDRLRGVRAELEALQLMERIELDRPYKGTRLVELEGLMRKIRESGKDFLSPRYYALLAQQAADPKTLLLLHQEITGVPTTNLVQEWSERQHVAKFRQLDGSFRVGICGAFEVMADGQQPAVMAALRGALHELAKRITGTITVVPLRGWAPRGSGLIDLAERPDWLKPQGHGASDTFQLGGGEHLDELKGAHLRAFKAVVALGGRYSGKQERAYARVCRERRPWVPVPLPGPSVPTGEGGKDATQVLEVIERAPFHPTARALSSWQIRRLKSVPGLPPGDAGGRELEKVLYRAVRAAVAHDEPEFDLSQSRAFWLGIGLLFLLMLTVAYYSTRARIEAEGFQRHVLSPVCDWIAAANNLSFQDADLEQCYGPVERLLSMRGPQQEISADDYNFHQYVVMGEVDDRAVSGKLIYVIPRNQVSDDAYVKFRLRSGVAGSEVEPEARASQIPVKCAVSASDLSLEGLPAHACSFHPNTAATETVVECSTKVRRGAALVCLSLFDDEPEPFQVWTLPPLPWSGDRRFGFYATTVGAALPPRVAASYEMANAQENQGAVVRSFDLDPRSLIALTELSPQGAAPGHVAKGSPPTRMQLEGILRHMLVKWPELRGVRDVSEPEEQSTARRRLAGLLGVDVESDTPSAGRWGTGPVRHYVLLRNPAITDPNPAEQGRQPTQILHMLTLFGSDYVGRVPTTRELSDERLWLEGSAREVLQAYFMDTSGGRFESWAKEFMAAVEGEIELASRGAALAGLPSRRRQPLVFEQERGLGSMFDSVTRRDYLINQVAWDFADPAVIDAESLVTADLNMLAEGFLSVIAERLIQPSGSDVAAPTLDTLAKQMKLDPRVARNLDVSLVYLGIALKGQEEIPTGGRSAWMSWPVYNDRAMEFFVTERPWWTAAIEGGTTLDERSCGLTHPYRDYSDVGASAEVRTFACELKIPYDHPLFEMVVLAIDFRWAGSRP